MFLLEGTEKYSLIHLHTALTIDVSRLGLINDHVHGLHVKMTAETVPLFQVKRGQDSAGINQNAFLSHSDQNSIASDRSQSRRSASSSSRFNPSTLAALLGESRPDKNASANSVTNLCENCLGATSSVTETLFDLSLSQVGWSISLRLSNLNASAEAETPKYVDSSKSSEASALSTPSNFEYSTSVGRRSAEANLSASFSILSFLAVPRAPTSLDSNVSGGSASHVIT